MYLAGMMTSHNATMHYSLELPHTFVFTTYHLYLSAVIVLNVEFLIGAQNLVFCTRINNDGHISVYSTTFALICVHGI